MASYGNVKLLQNKEQNVNINVEVVEIWYATAIPMYKHPSLHLSHNMTSALLSDGISATCLPHSAGPVQPQPSPVVKQLQSYPSWQPVLVESFHPV